MFGFLKKVPFLANLLKIISVIVVTLSTIFFCFVAFVVIAVVLIVMAFPQEVVDTDQVIYGKEAATNKLLSIKLQGMIVGSKDDLGDPLGLLSDQVAYGYEIKKELQEAAKDSSIKGVVLEINSPGGTIYGANAIADGINYYRQKTNNPVFAHVSGLAASGAYWAAVTTDQILVDTGSETGSIGVIFGPFKYYDKVVSEDGGLLAGGVVTQNGIDTFYFTAGKYKDLGNPFRKLSNEEVQAMQRMVNNEYDLFVRHVSSRRNISEQTIRDTIGALIYDNKTAAELHLVDSVASKEEAYAMLAKEAGLKEGRYKVVQEKKKGQGFRELLQSSSFLRGDQLQGAKGCSVVKTTLAYYGNLAEICN